MKIDSDLNDKINKFIESYRENFVRDICDLVKIRSVAVDGSNAPPFGEGCRTVLDKAIEISSNLGFETDNCDYYCASASLAHNDNSPYIGFWGHLDVVPEGAGWTYPPYSPTLHEGYIIGRGAIDNKGPTICALYTLLFFAEHEYNLKYNYKVIFGTNEERGMEDVQYFINHRQLPVFSIISDSVYPVCYAEKGIFRAEIEMPVFFEDVIDLSGGVVSNAVANSAEIRLKKFDNIHTATVPSEISVEDKDDCLIIRATGIGAHAASPEVSKNAIHLLTSFLKDIIQSESMKRSFSIISDMTGSYDGSNFDIKYSDGITGELTCVIGVLKYKNNKITLGVDIRYPIKTDVEEMVKKIETYCNNCGSELINIHDSKPCYVDPDDKMVVALNHLYNDFMGTDIPPYYDGGGSYARKVPNSLAFGPVLHKRKPKPISVAHGGAHKSDESLCIDEILLALKINIVTVLELDNMKLK
jgi:succinyl-diaminopimelate desuccinylase